MSERPSDWIVDVYRAGVNSPPAVRVTHRPTGISESVDDARSELEALNRAKDAIRLRLGEPTNAEELAEHLRGRADAAVIMHRPEESADEVIETMLASGVFEIDLTQPTEYKAGKRIRYLRRKTS